MESEKKIHKGGFHIIFEPYNLQEINASPFSKGWFDRTGCLRFFDKIMEEGCHLQFTSLFATSFSMGKAIIVGVEFNLSVDVISSATSIPSHGKKWFKGIYIHLEYYKLFLKPHARENPEHIFPFRNILKKYAPLMRLIMKYYVKGDSLVCIGTISNSPKVTPDA